MIPQAKPLLTSTPLTTPPSQDTSTLPKPAKPRINQTTGRVILHREGDSTSKTPANQHALNHSTLPRHFRPPDSTPQQPRNHSTLLRPSKPPKSRITQTTRKAIPHPESHSVSGGRFCTRRVIPPTKALLTSTPPTIPPSQTDITSKIPHQPNNQEGKSAPGGRFYTGRVILYQKGDSAPGG